MLKATSASTGVELEAMANDYFFCWVVVSG